ncbi:MAG TPA: carboxypeptidase regulatory-like domain-containing protein [Blastocatellia bacterium]|nr:carboxypeptidase regulatory-like domain-containing protein [Blastocatellia bacterium]
MKRKLFSYLFVFAFLLAQTHVLIPVAAAQAGQAELSGEVHDQTGATITTVRVTLTAVETKQVITTTSGESGFYSFTNITPGSYTIIAEAAGFKRYLQEGIRLSTGERVRADIALTLGSVDESITVIADASLLRTETASLGQVINNRTIVSLPLNGRNFLSLVALTAGVAAPPRTADGPSLPRINGGRPRVNEFLYDGISVLQPEPGQVAFFPIIDAIQEIKVEVNSPPAEFGRFNGGVINLSTKSGTNQLHGTVFEFLRNEVLNARNLFSPKTAANPDKPDFRRNQFGFVLGGPIVRDKTFFFGDYQGTRQLVGRTRISTVPTLAQRRGDFSANLGLPLFRTPAGVITTVPEGNTPVNVIDTNGNTIQARVGQIFRPADKRAYAGNMVPIAAFDSTASQLLGRYPLPTSGGLANNFTRTANEPLNQDQFDVRIDHRFSDHDRLFGRYSYASEEVDPVTPLPEGSGNITAGAIGLMNTGAQSFVANYIHSFGTEVLNELRFGYTRRAVARTSTPLDAPPSESLGIPGIPSNAAFEDALPTFSIGGLQQLGPPVNTNSDFSTDVTEIYDALSLQRGRHSIKTGIDFRLERMNVIQPPSPTGLFTFNTVLTSSQGIATIGTPLASFTGNSLASFLLGQVQAFSIDLQENKFHPRARILEFFGQDSWKATPRLTINAGLRYTLNFPSTELNNQGAVFNLQTQQLQYLGRDGFPETARELHRLNLGPRFGIAYSLSDKTVVRGGYGVIWQEQAGITTPFTIPQFPFLQTVTQRSLDNRNPAFVLSKGPSVAPIPLTADAGLGQGVFSVDRGLGSGYVQQWNVAIQRELTRDMVVEVAYAGSKITHVGMPDTNLNQLTAEQLKIGAPLLERVPNPFFGQIPRSSSLGDPTIPRAQLLKPFPEFTTVSLYRNNVGNTNYNALQAKVEQRLSRGLSYLICYTRSKLIDEASSVFDASILSGPVANFPVADSLDRHLERDVSSGDIPNVFVASLTYELPFGTGRIFHPAGIAGKIVSGWELSAFINLQSGIPLAVTQVTNFNAFAGFGTQRPNRVANPELTGSQRGADHFINTDAFQVAPQFTLGTSSRNPVRGPAYRNADLALSKRTYLHERMNLEFRAEFFNLTNTPPLGAPNVVLGSAGFGSITSAGDPRVIQFGLKLNF